MQYPWQQKIRVSFFLQGLPPTAIVAVAYIKEEHKQALAEAGGGL
jgi:hypothetical protein